MECSAQRGGDRKAVPKSPPDFVASEREHRPRFPDIHHHHPLPPALKLTSIGNDWKGGWIGGNSFPEPLGRLALESGLCRKVRAPAARMATLETWPGAPWAFPTTHICDPAVRTGCGLLTLGHKLRKNILLAETPKGKKCNSLILILNKESVLGFLKSWEKKKYMGTFKAFLVWCIVKQGEQIFPSRVNIPLFQEATLIDIWILNRKVSFPEGRNADHAFPRGSCVTTVTQEAVLNKGEIAALQIGLCRKMFHL